MNFGTYNPAAARKIEQELANRGYYCFVDGNNFIAECYKKTVNLFEHLFPKSYLPEKLDVKNLNTGRRVYARYNSADNRVTCNQEHDFYCFYNLYTLKEEAKKRHGFILPGWSSTDHPAHTFVHEFAHAAHRNNLRNRHGFLIAKNTMEALHYTTVPTSIGRLITKFKISGYAATGNMKEFLAERMTKDICTNLVSDELWLTYLKNSDVDYSDIFSRKWSYRYSSPQSYIDYFTQQVWNGDIEGAERVGEDAGLYLARLEAQTVPQTVLRVEKMTQEVPVLESITKGISSLFTIFTQQRDKKNDLMLHKELKRY